MDVRPEKVEDVDAIAAVNASAFGRDAEGNLVNALRRVGALTLSLVAVVNGRVVGHIAFSPGCVQGDGFAYDAVALGPMAVDPAFQGRGVGSRMVRTALEMLRERQAGAVFVLGHAGYYPRFGFVPAQTFGVQCEFAVAPENFMVWAPGDAIPAGLRPDGGTFNYHPKFRGV